MPSGRVAVGDFCKVCGEGRDESPPFSHGMCARCDQRVRYRSKKAGVPYDVSLAYDAPARVKKPCKWPGCDRLAQTSGVCQKHLHHLKKQEGT